ncbi:Retrovirus-related Pol polyprotein from transposon TNT 1-94 [Gossypium australe]|uniref:Retrovirus-related Pol polyprotein from transposon TNT 1-94 n=1 Tax=Gossypium australe TaxID=47621 RepID=A0A5B6WD17_9ROSI|nr:Retrovirus-related Pol polyprotein from transposon TNT 1-94 [Gossypium australe]
MRKCQLFSTDIHKTWYIYLKEFHMLPIVGSLFPTGCQRIHPDTKHDWPLYQLDVKNVFLYGGLNDEVYINKVIYGLKQNPRAWFDKFNQVVFAVGFKRKAFAATIVTKDLGQLRYFLGIEVTCGKECVVLSQRKYAINLLQETCLLGAKPLNTPIKPNLDLWKEDDDFIDHGQYRKFVGKLIYLTITRPDIMHVVDLISQFMDKLKKGHWEAACNILRYIKKSSRKMIMSKKQTVVSRSSAKAEYCAVAYMTCELISLKVLLKDFSIIYSDPIPMHCDNHVAIHIASNPIFINGQSTSKSIVIW